MESEIVNDIDLNELTDAVRLWFEAKGITSGDEKATPVQQFDKLLEEVQELAEGLGVEAVEEPRGTLSTQTYVNGKRNQSEIVDAIGDCTVVLIGLAKLCGTSFEECLSTAYGVISKRTGHMKNGIFIKDV